MQQCQDRMGVRWVKDRTGWGGWGRGVQQCQDRMGVRWVKDRTGKGGGGRGCSNVRIGWG